MPFVPFVAQPPKHLLVACSDFLWGQVSVFGGMHLCGELRVGGGEIVESLQCDTVCAVRTTIPGGSCPNQCLPLMAEFIDPPHFLVSASLYHAGR